MYKSAKRLIITMALLFVALGSSTAFADGHKMPFFDSIPTGVVSPCQQLWLVNDPNNANELPPPDGQGVCVDVPVAFHHQVKVVFNMDTPVMSGPNPVGLRHMVLFAKAMQHQVEVGNLDADDISIIGIFHGTTMTSAHWPFKDSPVAGWISKVLAFNHPTDGSPVIHTQIEACGVTLKGMEQAGATLADGTPVSKLAILPGVLVNQGAVARLIYLQLHGYAYIQEGAIDND